ncbi:uncharacterized protein PGTG_21096 [Puccinia graminis f. sp. tritici CRL 75-36-700-3]|uniref:Uncharacterized protein n=1 Tax=Puccinia graminis f. sp. tritici (strain CRL 75-36-700-3 / race SCCL) TaxID=418459 RepID=H6QQD6_PUCGT|nr:uncharacterized protein PGTG_21096 [Puccinia graminis f. sp. tritici CRL 75-36-700-3]EHS62548.1 hypothetical protein PGTG_21096 [Puccinia graminis f. sp. tritici CRL 75-36-700-3]
MHAPEAALTVRDGACGTGCRCQGKPQDGGVHRRGCRVGIHLCERGRRWDLSRLQTTMAGRGILPAIKPSTLDGQRDSSSAIDLSTSDGQKDSSPSHRDHTVSAAGR